MIELFMLESASCGQLVRLHDMGVRLYTSSSALADNEQLGIAARDIEAGEIIKYNPLANTGDIITRTGAGQCLTQI